MLFQAIRLSACGPLNSVRIGAPGAENYERIRAHAQNAPKLFRVAAVAWHIFIFVPGGAAGSMAWLAVISKKPERRHARLHFCKLRQLPHSRIVWPSAKCRMPGERSGRSQVAAFTDCRSIRRSRAAIRRILHSPGGCWHGRIFDFRRGQEALRAPFPRNGESDLFVIIFCQKVGPAAPHGIGRQAPPALPARRFWQRVACLLFGGQMTQNIPAIECARIRLATLAKCRASPACPLLPACRHRSRRHRRACPRRPSPFCTPS